LAKPFRSNPDRTRNAVWRRPALRGSAHHDDDPAPARFGRRLAPPLMARRRTTSEALNPWPGYVDALSTLLMVIIFVLLVFVLAQAFLSVALSGRDRALDRLNRQVAELSDMLSLEKGRSSELRLSITQLSREVQEAGSERDSLALQLGVLRATAARVGAERDSLKSERDRLDAQLADQTALVQAAETRNAQLQAQLADAARRNDAAGQDAAATAADLAQTRAQLATARDLLDEMRRQAEAADRTVQTDQATLSEKLSDLAKLALQVQQLTALRDQLEAQAQDVAVRATTEAQRRAAVAAELADETKLADSQRAQLALMTQQVSGLRDELASVKAALQAADVSGKDKDVQIANLGQRLNAALAQKVQELQSYRSEFFGKLREVLAGRPGIAVVGDRFVFQSEVLFPAGSDALSPAGQDQVAQLAATLKDISKQIPPEVNWLLRVDGHADHQPVDPTGNFVDNWDLSAKRAINVVKLLIADGVPPERLAATAFADYQPLDAASTPEAYAKNRRIEIRLTDR
jgi:chemotaxis protein MotB